MLRLGGLVFLRLGVGQSLRFKVSFLTFARVSQSYVRGLVFLRLGVSQCYV